MATLDEAEPFIAPIIMANMVEEDNLCNSSKDIKEEEAKYDDHPEMGEMGTTTRGCDLGGNHLVQMVVSRMHAVSTVLVQSGNHRGNI
jgi:hypothetical protein